jgi:replicative DNA helicase
MMRLDAVADGIAPADGTPTGFPTLDKLLGGGLRRGDLIVLGGDVGVGKSALALAIALRTRAAGHRVAIFSGEMDTQRILERALAIEGRTSIDSIRQGKLDESTRASLGAAALRMRDALPIIVPTPTMGTTEACLEIQALAETERLELVVVDPLQFVPAGALPYDEDLAFAVRQLKAAAVREQVALLLTAHLPAFDRTRNNQRPTLDDFGAMGAVKHHADVVLALFREELYAPSPGHEGATELHILKNRAGTTTYVDLYFYKQWLRFEDMVE